MTKTLTELLNLVRNLPTNEAMVLEAIRLLPDINEIDPQTGLSALLAVLAKPCPAVLAAVLARSPDVSAANEEEEVALTVTAMGSYDAPLPPLLPIDVGMTPYDVLRAIHHGVEKAAAALAHTPRPGGSAASRYDAHAQRIEQALVAFAAMQDQLVAAGAGEGVPRARKSQPAWRPAIDAQVVRVGERFGADRARVIALLDEMDARDLGPFSTFCRGVKELRALATVEFDEEAASRSVLARILAGRESDGELPESFEYYPEEARAPLRQASILAHYDADIWFAWPVGDDFHVAHAHPEGMQVLGTTVESFIAQELDKLL